MRRPLDKEVYYYDSTANILLLNLATWQYDMFSLGPGLLYNIYNANFFLVTSFEVLTRFATINP